MAITRREICERIAGAPLLLNGSIRAIAAEGSITLETPPDGGTPRDPSRLVRVGPAAFRIRAHAVEGQSELKHAVARADLLLRNTSSLTDVTLEFDLSADGTRTQQNAEALRRDYIYIQAPGQTWQRIDGSAREWTCT